MRVSTDSEREQAQGSPYADLFRLQTEFQARLTDETLRYLRRLQGAFAPAAPGTVLKPSDGIELAASGAAGGSVDVSLEVENLQRVHCLVTPLLTPLIASSGITWFPAAQPRSLSSLLEPESLRTLTITIPLPARLPPGRYRGALLLQGFRNNAIPLTVTVVRAGRSTRSRGKARRRGRRPRRRA